MKTVVTPAARITIFAALIIWAIISLLPQKRLAPLPATAPEGEFSAARAMRHVEAIAQRPHPAGSPENDRVRDYVRGELGRLGFESELQAGTEKPIWGRDLTPVQVTNIVTRMTGTASTRPLMLVAHYDSVTRGPGAADDAAGVAVLLEAARVLRHTEPLRNDVIFLFTDGEERGLLGAKLFMRSHRWSREPGVILNVDCAARGGKPGVIESSEADEWLVREMRAAVPDLNGLSLLTSVLPKAGLVSTDLKPMRSAGMKGLTIAFGSDPDLRHAPGDTPSIIEQSSIQELGSYALAGLHRFGNVSLRQAHSGDAVYFSTPAGLIVYSDWWALPLATIAVVGLALVAWAGFRRRVRGAWMAIPLGLLAIVQLLVAARVPAASAPLTWPALAGVISLGVLLTAPEKLAVGWRLSLLAISPAAAFVMLLPIIQLTMVLIPIRSPTYWVPPVVCVTVLIVITLSPQLLLLFRRRFVATAAPVGVGQ